MTSNRNPVKQWSITFPQSGTVSRESFAVSFPPAEHIICSQEEHKVEGFHLHLGIKLRKPITKSKMLKWITRKWPNDYKRIDVQATRNIDCWNDYISKEDPDAFRWKDLRSRHTQLIKRAHRWLTSVGVNPDTSEWFIKFKQDMSSCHLA